MSKTKRKAAANRLKEASEEFNLAFKECITAGLFIETGGYHSSYEFQQDFGEEWQEFDYLCLDTLQYQEPAEDYT